LTEAGKQLDINLYTWYTWQSHCGILCQYYLKEWAWHKTALWTFFTFCGLSNAGYNQ